MASPSLLPENVAISITRKRIKAVMGVNPSASRRGPPRCRIQQPFVSRLNGNAPGKRGGKLIEGEREQPFPRARMVFRRVVERAPLPRPHIPGRALRAGL